MKNLFLSLRRLRGRTDRRLAREWQDLLSHELDPETARRLRAFLARYSGGRNRDTLWLGQHLLTDSATPIGMSVGELLSQHGWITGATGSGKTRFAQGALIQLMRRPRLPKIILDFKGELSRDAQENLLPGLLNEPGVAEQLAQLRIIRPYGSPYIPLLRLTEPELGIASEVQALNLAMSLAEALGQDLGIRMERLFLKLCALAIELREPLTTIHRWLENPVSLARDALRSQDPSLRGYVRESFERETGSTREALLARLDGFFLLRETRLALSAPRCLSFGECLESGVTIVNLGEPPAGAERVSKFWAAVLVGRLSRAILSRAVTEGTPPVMVILEEFQEALSGSQIEQFKRLLALARYKKVALWFVNQQVSQLAAVDPALPKILRTNTGIEVIFRCNAEDARLLAPVLGGGAPRRGDHRPDPIRELVTLRDREFLFWAKREAFGSQKLRSLDLDMDAFREAARTVDPAVRQAMEQGSVALPRRDLEALVTPARENRAAAAEPPPPARPRAGHGRFPGLG